MSGPPGNVLLNFDQVITGNDNELVFQASGAVNALGGLVSDKIAKGAIKFVKLGKKDREKVFQDQIRSYIADDLKLLEESLNQNDPKKARLYKELILSIGGEIPKPVHERLAKQDGKQ